MDVKNITSSLAASLLKELDNSILIDVRTKEEWKEVGIPDIEINRLLLLTWRREPHMIINSDFRATLVSIQPDKTSIMFFICRSGVRSYEAANFALSLGYNNCYNIWDGFEGGVNGPGWKQNNLPFRIL